MSETRCLALQGKQRGPSLDRQGLAPTLKSWNLYSHSPQCLLHQKGMDDLLSDPPPLWTGFYAIRFNNVLAKLLTTMPRQSQVNGMQNIFYVE